MKAPDVLPVGRFRTKHFVQPDVFPGAEYEKGKVYDCTNFRTNEVTKAAFTGEQFNYTWDQYPGSFFITSFDSTREELRKALEAKFPDVRYIKTMRFLIMKEI